MDDWYKFTGKELEKGFGIFYFGARFYNPHLGSWLSVDPYSFQLVDQTKRAIGSNSYNYVSNKPYTRADPDGLDEIIIVSNHPKSSQFAKMMKVANRYKANIEKKTKNKVYIIKAMDYHTLSLKLGKHLKEIQTRQKTNSKIRLTRFSMIGHMYGAGFEIYRDKSSSKNLGWKGFARLSSKYKSMIKKVSKNQRVIGHLVGCSFFGRSYGFRPTKRARRLAYYYLRRLLGGKSIIRHHISYDGGVRSKGKKGTDTVFSLVRKKPMLGDFYRETAKGKPTWYYYTLEDALNKSKYYGDVTPDGTVQPAGNRPRVVPNSNLQFRPKPPRPVR